MSATPDYMTQLLSGGNNTGLNGMFTNSMYSPQMGLALGLLQAGGPSRMPVSLGQALGQGMQTGQQFQGAGLQNAMQRLMLGQNIQGIQAMQQAGQGNAPIPAAFQAFAPQGASNASSQPPIQSAPPAATQGQAPIINALNPPQATPSQPSPGQPPVTQQPWAPLSQIAQDTQRLRVLESMPNNPTFAKAAADLRAQMGASYFDVPPNMIPGGAVPGQQYQINELGEKKTVGDPAIKTIQVMTPMGTMATVPYDVRTGKINDIGGVLAPKDYSQPLKSPYLEDLAQRFSRFQAPATAVSSRNPGVADAIARADYLNRDIGGFDQTTYPMKLKAMQSLSSGKDYQQNSAYSTIQTHMQTLDDAMSALNNGNVQDANKLTQWAGKKLGNSAPQNAKVVNDIVVGELAKVLAQGGQVTDSVRSEAAGDLEPYLSKGQYQGATNYIRQLIAGKMNTSYINAQANHIPDDVFMSHLTPEARQQLQIFRQSHPDQQYSMPTGNVNVKNLSNAELLKQLGVPGG